MRRYRYRLLNVFSRKGEPFSGNPLCVFEHGAGLSDDEMQALARQFNLSETTFILPASGSAPRVRIFTPAFEMPFAGHPTLGTAHVVRSLQDTGSELTLRMAVGDIPVSAQGDRWTLQAPTATVREPGLARKDLACLLGIAEADLAGPALWVSAGNDQLLVPVASAEALLRCQPTIDHLRRFARVNDERSLVYAFTDPYAERVQARLFFSAGAAVSEDPATGSACANLGGYLLAQPHISPPFVRYVEQGQVLRRPSLLELHVNAAGRIHVTGAVTELGAGYVEF